MPPVKSESIYRDNKMTFDELSEMAYRIASAKIPSLKNLPVGDSAIYTFWKSNKHVGVPVTLEYTLDDETKAVITSGGYILHWDGSVVKIY